MNVLSHTSIYVPSICILVFSACLSMASLANGTHTPPPSNEQNFVPSLAGINMTEEVRWTIKREVMSKPGVMLDMANMTDKGYAWINDVVWVDSGASASDQWYVAGFLFERPRYKDVWLQYAFTLSNLSGNIANFRRWYGDAVFR